MYFLFLIARNVYTRKMRTTLTGVAIAISIAVVVAMGVLTHSLRKTASNILNTALADFTVAQKGVADITFSSLDQADLDAIREQDGVSLAMGLLIAPVKVDDDHPFFLELGLPANELEPFGIQVVAGRKYSDGAPDEIMLGYRAAQELRKTVGDTIVLNQPDPHTYEVVGIYKTGQVAGDSASMLPLKRLQADQRKIGVLTMVFVRLKPETDIESVRKSIETEHPQLATVKTLEDFNQVDRNIQLISAANIGVSALALVIGAVTILNTMLLSVFERTREFGILRAVGWSRLRVLLCIMLEAVVVSLTGAMMGVGFGFLSVKLLEISPQMFGVFEPDYPPGVFRNALLIAFGMAFFGAVFPAIRASLLRPLDAIRHE